MQGHVVQMIWKVATSFVATATDVTTTPAGKAAITCSMPSTRQLLPMKTPHKKS